MGKQTSPKAWISSHGGVSEAIALAATKYEMLGLDFTKIVKTEDGSLLSSCISHLVSPLTIDVATARDHQAKGTTEVKVAIVGGFLNGASALLLLRLKMFRNPFGYLMRQGALGNYNTSVSHRREIKFFFQTFANSITYCLMLVSFHVIARIVPAGICVVLATTTAWELAHAGGG
ncbi:hypothetical protein ANCCEY_05064 [Ancylostoma ceylanicum]|uniref:7TM GPCR serpentine receptor class x (Srx) domain-containing protein n=1 Tax=Ancylostoma ceylanicum TaxID=53326 RepID=A0A0D6LVI0_9BILA|nr:hypothetical protein ANCCEY_05064 [Ancylostoma ceylanicum]